MSPLLCAIMCKNTAYLKMIIDAGQKLGKTVNSREANGWTPTMLACENGNSHALHLLLDHGVNIDAQNDHGATALMIACARGHDKCVALLVDAGANVNTRYKQGGTALMWACEYGHIKCARVLVAVNGHVCVAHGIQSECVTNVPRSCLTVAHVPHTMPRVST